MNTLSSKIIAKHSVIGTCVLYSPPSSWTIFGDDSLDDLVIRWSANEKTSKPSLWQNGKVVDIPVKNCLALNETIKHLANAAAFGSFSISEDYLAVIKQTADKYKATHVRFVCLDKKMEVRVFDYRQFVTRRIKRKNTHQVQTIQLRDANSADFTFTLKAGTFKRLEASNYQVRVGRNGIVAFSSTKDEITYLIRDQDIHEPVATFFSPTLNQKIAFVPAPKS